MGASASAGIIVRVPLGKRAKRHLKRRVRRL